MWTVLQAKFKPGSSAASFLDQTGNAFLIEHNEKTGRDAYWSDNYDGSGYNMLGFQLMKLRALNRGIEDQFSNTVDSRGNIVDINWQRNVINNAKILLDLNL